MFGELIWIAFDGEQNLALATQWPHHVCNIQNCAGTEAHIMVYAAAKLNTVASHSNRIYNFHGCASLWATGRQQHPQLFCLLQTCVLYYISLELVRMMLMMTPTRCRGKPCWATKRTTILTRLFSIRFRSKQ